jgi:DNA polymerase-3 subunit gamma/tau
VIPGRTIIFCVVSEPPLFTADVPDTEETPQPSVESPRQSGQVLYRRWRPQSFAEVSGQESVTRTLRNSIAQDRLAHAYLFCGPRGTGKTTLGRLLAKAANCESPVDGDPCNACVSCIAYSEGRAMDFVEQDAASHNGVDDIRQLRENVILAPMAGRRKVYLLDEVHMLSVPAQNALLKTLEEPPPHIIFVLATTEVHKVASTVISRCQRFDLKRIPNRAVIERLSVICEREGFHLSDDSLGEIARAATGSLRDAIMALQQVVSEYGASPTADQVQDALGLRVDVRSAEFGRLALGGDVAGALAVSAEVRDDGVDHRLFTRQLVQYLRGVAMVASGATDMDDLPQELAGKVRAQAQGTSAVEALRALRVFGTIDWRRFESSGIGGSLPLELALAEFVSQRSSPPNHEVSPSRQEPRFSVPAAATIGVDATVTDTRVEEVVHDDSAAGTPARSTGRDVPPVPLSAASEHLLAKVREVLKQTDRLQAGILNGSCDIISNDGSEVVLGFYHTFHLERAEGAEYRDAIQRAFSAVLGKPVSVQLTHAPRQPVEEKPRQPGGHLVKAAREQHGARAVPGDD